MFWGSPIGASGERNGDLSWAANAPAVFGTPRALGPLATGWTGFNTGVVSRPVWPGKDGLWLANESAGGALGNVAGALADTVGMGRGVEAGVNAVPSMPLWLLAAGSGLVAGVAEALELGGVDDNLSLPILSACGIWSLLWSWGAAATAWKGWSGSA